MKVKLILVGEDQQGGKSYEFKVIEYCCEDAKEKFDNYGDQEYWELDGKDGLAVGHGHDYWIHPMRYCPFCGTKVVITDDHLNKDILQ